MCTCWEKDRRNGGNQVKKWDPQTQKWGTNEHWLPGSFLWQLWRRRCMEAVLRVSCCDAPCFACVPEDGCSLGLGWEESLHRNLWKQLLGQPGLSWPRPWQLVHEHHLMTAAGCCWAVHWVPTCPVWGEEIQGKRHSPHIHNSLWVRSLMREIIICLHKG